MRSSTKWWAGMVVMAVALMGATGCTRNAEALQSFELLNAERSARGLPHVTLDGQLIDKAHGWAEVMSRTGVRHSVLTEGAGDTWMVLAENVGAAPNVTEMNRLFMASPLHRSIILDRRMTKVGTGVAVANGRVYVVQVFSG